jgi:hypothetical protein
MPNRGGGNQRDPGSYNRYAFQQGTFAPDATFRWMGSIAMDRAGNIGLGYSASSTAIHPQIRVTGRRAGDPAGQMTQAEGTVIAGGGSQTRLSCWGDYSSMQVDPADGCVIRQGFVTTARPPGIRESGPLAVHAPRSMGTGSPTPRVVPTKGCPRNQEVPMANRALATAATCTFAVLVLSACVGGRPGGPASAQPSSQGSAPDASARPAPGTPTPPGTPSGACAGNARQVTVRPAETPAPVCLPVGAVLRIDAPPSPRQPWQPFVTSDPQVITCTTTAGRDGAATATCHAVRAGSATVSTMTAPFAGDPHGPMQQLWELQVEVRER